MIKRELSKETKIKMLKLCAEIIGMHGSVAGDRCCQDWSGEQAKPSAIFTDKERDDLEYNSQIENSQLDDYEEGLDFFDDEMSVSFTMMNNLNDYITELENQND